MSLLGFVNYYILQWFFIRLAIVQWDVHAVVGDKQWTLCKFKLLKGIYPLSGWNGKPYRYINDKKKESIYKD